EVLESNCRVEGYRFLVPYAEALEVMFNAFGIRELSCGGSQKSEHRIHARVLSENIRVRCKVEGYDRWLKAVCGNLSTGGILLISEVSIPEGAVLSIEVGLPDSASVIKLKGRVVWKQEMHSVIVQKFKHGVQFDAVREKERKMIQEYVDRSLETEEEEGRQAS
ncbi:MAG: PilZ domain-containing protein, partial [Armatimonadetes bacterium]|nr:PilZ domain-containing protein [Armatimonadota bacterium]